ncbi:MAG: lytic transglycosylase domain-containing protein [Clostridia bacterium]|nr:lytic transglycosylase domain-containing protein [Clostridia bacterium]
MTSNFKKSVRMSAVILTILIASILCAFLYQTIWDAIDRSRYPQEYSEYVTEYSRRFGVPEHVIYAVIKVESDFVSNAVSPAGAVGLMQITPDTFSWISMLMKRSDDTGMLYDPETNIEYGTYLLSYLYMRYNRWDTVFAAYNAGMTRVDEWLTTPDYTDGDGRLTNVPYKETRKYIDRVNDSIRVYKRLYGETY